MYCSNNTNKLSPQELHWQHRSRLNRSNNTNKLSPQEPKFMPLGKNSVQIIQINLVLKNGLKDSSLFILVQIIQINLVLKNHL